MELLRKTGVELYLCLSKNVQTINKNSDFKTETSKQKEKPRVAPRDSDNKACRLTIHAMKTSTAIGNYSVCVSIHGNTRKDRRRQSGPKKRQKYSTRSPRISQQMLSWFLLGSIFHKVM